VNKSSSALNIPDLHRIERERERERERDATTAPTPPVRHQGDSKLKKTNLSRTSNCSWLQVTSCLSAR
jgi:hypothetical protein